MISRDCFSIFFFDFFKAVDNDTNQCDWSMHTDLECSPRYPYAKNMYQLKFCAASVVDKVTTKMLHACGFKIIFFFLIFFLFLF